MTEANVLTERQQYWFDHIQAARSAGISLARYAREHDLKPKDLYQWGAILVRRGVLAPKVRDDRLVPVQFSTSPACAVQFANGARLELAELPTGNSLRELFDCLRQS